MPPKIVAVFLIQFDVKVGYKIIWSKKNISISLDGIEFKSLPSGIHEFSEDLISFAHTVNDQVYYGVSKFRQNMETDRDQIKMFSIGCLCKPDDKSSTEEWHPRDFTSNGYEYIPFLDDLLLDYLKGIDKITTNLEISDIKARRFISPLFFLPSYFQRFGPLIFQIFKLGLLRKRILIINKSKRDNFELSMFTYLISILCIIPKLKVEIQGPTFIQPLYNISLNDIDLLPKVYVATTNDEILAYQPVYDIGIIIDDIPQIMSFENIQKSSHGHEGNNKLIKSTYNDFLKFKIAYDQLKFDDAVSVSNSVLSSTSFLTSLKPSISWKDYEVNWWESVTPVSWAQYIWSAFSWFASAGQINDEVIDRESNPQVSITNPDGQLSYSKSFDSNQVLDASTPQSHSKYPSRPSFNSQLSLVLAMSSDNLEILGFIDIIGYFHKLTKKWIFLIDEIVKDELYQGTLELNYQDLIDLELDPYSSQDKEFIINFIQLYWSIERVEISSGFGFFC